MRSISVGGVNVKTGAGRVVINCATPDCASTAVILDFAGAPPKSVLLVKQRSGLPPKADFLLRARPGWAVPSGTGDVSAAAVDIAIPAP